MGAKKSATKPRTLQDFAVEVMARKAYPLRPMRPLPANGKPRKHLVIPDRQNKPWAPVAHNRWIGQFIRDQRPDVIVDLGDGADMPSTSRHASRMELEGATVTDDLACANEANALLTEPWRGIRGYKPAAHVALGNHCDHLARMVSEDPRLRGVWGEDPFGYIDLGWTVHKHLAPFLLDGVQYCHFFPRGPNGKVTQSFRGAPTALAMIKREMRSCVAGHMQGLDTAILHTSDRTLRGVIAGSCYLHMEPYRTPMQATEWHGVLLFHEVHLGMFDIVEVSMDYLRRKYGRGQDPKPWIPRG